MLATFLPTEPLCVCWSRSATPDKKVTGVAHLAKKMTMI